MSTWQAKKTPGEERTLVHSTHDSAAKKAVWSWIFGLHLEFPYFGEFKSLGLMSCSYFCMGYFLSPLVIQYSKQCEVWVLLHMEKWMQWLTQAQNSSLQEGRGWHLLTPDLESIELHWRGLTREGSLLQDLTPRLQERRQNTGFARGKKSTNAIHFKKILIMIVFHLSPESWCFPDLKSLSIHWILEVIYVDQSRYSITNVLTGWKVSISNRTVLFKILKAAISNSKSGKWTKNMFFFLLTRSLLETRGK